MIRTIAHYLLILPLTLCCAPAQQNRVKQAPQPPTAFFLVKFPAAPVTQAPAAVQSCVPANTAEADMPVPELVQFPGADGVTLHGFIYRPPRANGKSPIHLPALFWNHGSEKSPGEQVFLAKFYVDHGFVFFIPHRRGHGRSADAGTWVGDLTSQP